MPKVKNKRTGNVWDVTDELYERLKDDPDHEEVKPARESKETRKRKTAESSGDEQGE